MKKNAGILKAQHGEDDELWHEFPDVQSAIEWLKQPLCNIDCGPGVYCIRPMDHQGAHIVEDLEDDDE